MDLDEIAAKADYQGSPYHKDVPLPGADRDRPILPVQRPDASICPRELAGCRDQVLRWLQDAIRHGWFGARWRNGFPEKVWTRQEGVVYEADLTGYGTYHGFPLEPWQEVRGLP